MSPRRSIQRCGVDPPTNADIPGRLVRVDSVVRGPDGASAHAGRPKTLRAHNWSSPPRTARIDDHRVPPLTANRVLNAIAHMIVNDGTVLAPPSSRPSKSSTPIRASEFAVALCGPQVRALQLVWADDRGRWPWDAAWGPAGEGNRCLVCEHDQAIRMTIGCKGAG